MPHFEAAGAIKQADRRNSQPGQGRRERQQTKTRQIDTTQSRVIFSAKKIRYSGNRDISPSKSQSTRRGGALGQALASKAYSFKDEHVVSLFKLLQKSNKLKLLEV